MKQVAQLNRKTDYRSAYCLKCQDKIDVNQAKQTVLLNGSKALRGFCPSCGQKVYRILPRLAQQTDWLSWAIYLCLGAAVLMAAYALLR